MTTIIQASGISLSEAIRSHLIRRFTLALRRHGDRIRRVNVFLGDVNGNKGGQDKRVLVSVELPDRSVVTVENYSHNLYVAISVAARRTQRAVRRTLRRQREFERQRLSELEVT